MVKLINKSTIPCFMKDRMLITVAALTLLLILSGCTGSQDNSGCAKISDKSYRDNCYYEQAVNSTDAGLCSSIKSESLRAGCISHIAVNTKDIRLCINSTDTKAIGYCYAQISINTQN